MPPYCPLTTGDRCFRTRRGCQKPNPWIEFLTAQGGQGWSRSQLSSTYQSVKTHNLLPGYGTSGKEVRKICTYTRTRQAKGIATAKRGADPAFDIPRQHRRQVAGVQIKHAWRSHIRRKQTHALQHRAGVKIQRAWRAHAHHKVSKQDVLLRGAITGLAALTLASRRSPTPNIIDLSSDDTVARRNPTHLIPPHVPVPAGPAFILPVSNAPPLDIKGALASFHAAELADGNALLKNGQLSPGSYSVGAQHYANPEQAAEAFEHQAWFTDIEIEGWCGMMRGPARQQGVLVLDVVHAFTWVNPAYLDAKVNEIYRNRGRGRWYKGGAAIRGVVLPLNVSGNHWIVLFFDRTSNTMYTINSFHTRHQEAAAFENTLQHLHLAQDHVQHVLLNVPLQRDGYQCGPWVCLYVACIACRRRLPPKQACMDLRRLMACLVCASTRYEVNTLIQHHVSILWLG